MTRGTDGSSSEETDKKEEAAEKEAEKAEEAKEADEDDEKKDKIQKVITPEKADDSVEAGEGSGEETAKKVEAPKQEAVVEEGSGADATFFQPTAEN